MVVVNSCGQHLQQGHKIVVVVVIVQLAIRGKYVNVEVKR